jgi:hypothetical protein
MSREITREQIVEKVERLIKNVSKFKIGKTGQTLKERFNEEYAGEYTDIEEICFSDNMTSIDDMEEYLIEQFGEYSNCTNEQIGSGKMTKSNRYYVYLVCK